MNLGQGITMQAVVGETVKPGSSGFVKSATSRPGCALCGRPGRGGRVFSLEKGGFLWGGGGGGGGAFNLFFPTRKGGGGGGRRGGEGGEEGGGLRGGALLIKLSFRAVHGRGRETRYPLACGSRPFIRVGASAGGVWFFSLKIGVFARGVGRGVGVPLLIQNQAQKRVSGGGLGERGENVLSL